jgi:hypothetical protein
MADGLVEEDGDEAWKFPEPGVSRSRRRAPNSTRGKMSG